MFTVRVPYLTILQQVAQQCCFPYISGRHEILEDGTYLYGIEVELPVPYSRVNSRTLFFFGKVLAWNRDGSTGYVRYALAYPAGLACIEYIYMYIYL